MTDYLVMEEKVAMPNSMVEVVEAEGLRLRKDLVEAMNQASEAKANLKDVYYKKNGLLQRAKSAAKAQKSATKGIFDL